MLKLKNLLNLIVSNQLNFKHLVCSYKTLNYTVNKTLQQIKTTFENDHLKIQISNGTNTNEKKYPYIWLRDCCHCTECFYSPSEQKQINLKNVPLDVKPKHISDLKSNASQFEIRWSDGHVSEFDLEKLAAFCFEQENKVDFVKPFYWDKNTIGDKLSDLTVDHNDYLNNEETLKKALGSLIKYGFTIVNNVPSSIESTQKAIERIGFLQKTLYGEITMLTSAGDKTDSSYTNVELKAHLDGFYLKDTPGLECFQLYKHDGSGGNTLLVDAFNAALELKKSFPEDFDALTKINVKGFYIEQNKHDTCHFDPIIKLNPINGSLFQIRFNSYDRRVPNYLSYEDTIKFYRAMQNFIKIIENERNEFWTRLKKGELLIIDNFRVMHGRSKFTGDRRLFTAYVPRDEWISKAQIYNLFKLY